MALASSAASCHAYRYGTKNPYGHGHDPGTRMRVVDRDRGFAAAAFISVTHPHRRMDDEEGEAKRLFADFLPASSSKPNSTGLKPEPLGRQRAAVVCTAEVRSGYDSCSSRDPFSASGALRRFDIRE
ncbi:hypothetical protein NHX12_002355 [Muraenolepis orangiensis]|uniref:Uncharacterized protein n=1 Tax=Muraenolepis orangiensis TaxID=630683 RepID=A0A9Q0IGB3_9TELE|nr:hypothetical protein NHX12_002355 [Muraenolepis orangiensis]